MNKSLSDRNIARAQKELPQVLPADVSAEVKGITLFQQ